jgi:hypothetical protein
MNKDGLKKVIESVSVSTQIPLTAEADFLARDQAIKIRIAGLSELDSFALHLHRSSMAWILVLEYDTFSAGLVKDINVQIVSNLEKFETECARIRRTGLILETNAKGIVEMSSLELENLPAFELTMFTDPPLDQSSIDRDLEIQKLTQLLENSLVLLYLLISHFDENPGVLGIGEIEGEIGRRSCNSYSRSARNRVLCLEKFGYVCHACGLNPESVYGQSGKKIIHVHHREPLSLMGEPKALDPYEDLVPLCPNCHNFAHKRNPPYSIDEIAAKLADVKASVAL